MAAMLYMKTIYKAPKYKVNISIQHTHNIFDVIHKYKDKLQELMLFLPFVNEKMSHCGVTNTNTNDSQR